MAKTCPKCGFEDQTGGPECPRCGLIYAKYKPPEPKPEPMEHEDKDRGLDGKIKQGKRPNLNTEIARIARECGDTQFLTKKELQYLPEIIQNGESILAFASGFMDNNSWLIVLTDRRIIFLDKGFLYGLKQTVIPLNRINAISGTTGILLGKIIITDGAGSRKISNVPKQTVKPFINKCQAALDALYSPSTAAATPQDDVYIKPEENEDAEYDLYPPKNNMDLPPVVGWITGIVFVLVALFSLSSFWESLWTHRTTRRPGNNDYQVEKTDQPTKKIYQPTKIDASIMAEEFVKQALKAPSTADFPWYNSDRVKSMGNNKYVVHSYVDAENSYGAKLRTWYICELRYIGNGKWFCENLVFDK